MTTRVRSFNVVQLALMYAIICAILGVVLGLIFGLVVGLGGGAMSSLSGMPNLGPLAVIAFPLVYGVALFVGGFIEGVIVAAVYNLVAGWLGGVEVQLETRV